jgi:hypothetical protein
MLNKWINDGKEKVRFTPVARRGSWTDFFPYLYKTMFKIKYLAKELCGQGSAAVLIVPVRADSSFGV